MKQWFYSEGGAQRGPIGEVELRNLLDSNKIPATTLVWSDGLQNWQPAFEVIEFTPSPYAPPLSDPAADIDWEGYTSSGSQVRPWVRYWARTFDFLAFSVIVGFIVGLTAPQLLQMPELVLGMVMLAIYNAVEPICFAMWGTTPFKALLNVRVRNEDGSKLTYLQALRRTLYVWIRGMGLGIPLVSLVTNITSYTRLTNQRITSWDADGHFTVSHRKVEWWRWVLMCLSLVGYVALTALGASE